MRGYVYEYEHGVSSAYTPVVASRLYISAIYLRPAGLEVGVMARLLLRYPPSEGVHVNRGVRAGEVVTVVHLWRDEWIN